MNLISERTERTQDIQINYLFITFKMDKSKKNVLVGEFGLPSCGAGVMLLFYYSWGILLKNNLK